MASLVRIERPRWGAIAALLAVWLFAASALGYVPPALTGHVVDTSGKLSREDIDAIDVALAKEQSRRGVEIVVLVVDTLGADALEDVAYDAFNGWGVGRSGRDNGVLLVIAAKERRVRIETGKGVGGALTDLRSSDIIQGMAPLLAEDRYREAIDLGTKAIADAVADGSPPEDSAPPVRTISLWRVGIYAALGLLVLLLAVISPAFRGVLLFFLMFGRGGRGGGGGGGGYSGGGGRSGGGGASGGF